MLFANGNKKQTDTRVKIVARAITLALWAVLSRILGLVRDLGMAWLVGAGALGDSLVLAIFIPHALRKLLADGVLSLPVTANAVASLGKDKGLLSRWRIAAPSLLFLCLTVLPFLCIVALLAPQFFAEDETVFLFRLALPYLFMVLLSAFAMGLLHARGDFGSASSTQVLFNLVMLAFLASAALGIWKPAEMTALGFSIAGLVQVFWLYSLLYYKKLSSFASPRREWCLSLRLRKSFSSLGPVVLAASSLPLSLLAAMLPARLAGEGVVSALYFADRLLELPIGIVGACVGMAILPDLSVSIAKRNVEGFLADLGFSLRIGLLFSLPAACGLWAIAPELSRLLLGHGVFSEVAQENVALTLRCLCFALPACVSLRALLAATHAYGLIRLAWVSSLITALFTLCIGLFLSLAFANCAGAIATSLALILQSIFLLRELFRRVEEDRRSLEKFFASLKKGDLARIGICGLVAGLVACLVVSLLPHLSLILLIVCACMAGGLGWGLCVFLFLPRDFALFAQKSS